MRWESECWWRQSLVWVYVKRFQVKRPTFQIRLGIRREKDEKRKKLCTRGCIYSQVYKQNSTTNRQQCNMNRVKEIRWNFWLSIFCQKLGVISTKHVSSSKCPSILSLSLCYVLKLQFVQFVRLVRIFVPSLSITWKAIQNEIYRAWDRIPKDSDNCWLQWAFLWLNVHCTAYTIRPSVYTEY